MKIFPVRTKVDGNIMTYGLWDRFITSLQHRLDWYVEQRTTRMWDEAEGRHSRVRPNH